MANYYKLHTKNNGAVVARGNYTSTNAATVGASNNYTFHILKDRGDKTFSSDDTTPSNKAHLYGNVTINSGVTLTVNGTLLCTTLTVNGTLDNNGTVTVDSDLEGDIATILPYSEWAGNYNTNTMIDGTIKYTDRIPSGESVNSIVLGIEPASDLEGKDVTPVWALIDSVNDQRTGPLGTDRVALDVTVLANYADYTRSTLETNLKLA